MWGKRVSVEGALLENAMEVNRLLSAQGNSLEHRTTPAAPLPTLSALQRKNTDTQLYSNTLLYY